MKIRKDFVTNSSSSSFIFKEFDLKKLEMAAEKMKESCDSWDKECIENEMTFLAKSICEFKAADVENLSFVFSWYEDEVLQSIFGKELQGDVWKEAAQMNMSEEQWKRWLAYVVLHMDMVYHNTANWGGQKNREIMTAEHLETIMEHYMFECWNGEGYEYIIGNQELLQREIRIFAGMHYGEVVACFLAAKYIYFKEWETYYMIKELVQEAGFCEFACCHMG